MLNEAQPAARAPKGLKTAGIVTAVIAVVIVAAGAVSRSHATTEAQGWSEARAIPTVHLVGVTGAGAADALALPGTLQAWNAAKIYARVGGYMRAWYRDIGAEVPAGAALGLIDTPELDQQIAQARADLANARGNAALSKSTAARWNDLLKTNSVSRQEADEKNGDLVSKTAIVASAAANLARLQAQRTFATLRAPFAGVVTARSADIGDLVGPGATTQQPLFAVADVHRIRVYVGVPQAYSAGIRPGLTATLALPEFPDRKFPAQVIGTSGAINAQTGTYQVQLIADNPGHVLKPGGYALVHFDVPGQAGSVRIPSSTLVFRAAGTQVAMVGPDQRIRLQPVTLGRDLGGSVEVVAGLTTGARIVDNPPDSLADGELVRIGGGNHG